MTQRINIKLINNYWGQPVYQYITNNKIPNYFILTITEKSLMCYLQKKLPTLLFLDTTEEHTQNLWRNWLFNQTTDQGKADYQTQHDNIINVCIQQTAKDDILREQEKTITQLINDNTEQQFHYIPYWTNLDFEVKIWHYDIHEESEEIIEIYASKIQKVLEDTLGTQNFSTIQIQRLEDQANTTGHCVQINFSIEFYKFLITKENIDKFESVYNRVIEEVQNYPRDNH